jgi:hypothetical protein
VFIGGSFCSQQREARVVRRIILNVHTYGGLLCFSYLVLFGISVVNFNHPFAFTKSPSSVTTWSQPMPLPGLERTDGKSEAEALKARRENNGAVLHALGSFAAPFTPADGGWTDADTYHAHFVRPGKGYEIDVRPGQGTATVTQTRASFWTLTRDLHGSAVVYPESIVASSWGWYTELCTFVVIAAGASGIYLWAGRRRERRVGLVVLGAAVTVSIALMLLITFRG